MSRLHLTRPSWVSQQSGPKAPLMITLFSVNLAHAKELMLTRDIVDAKEAARICWVSRVVHHDRPIMNSRKWLKKSACYRRLA